MSSVCAVPLSVSGRCPKVLIGLRPRWLQHIGNHKVLEDDQVFLHWQERVLERSGGSEASERAFFLPTRADVYVAALHRWINGNGGEPFAGQPLPPRQATEALMDRYHSHTVNCRSCSTALRRIQAIRPWLWGGLWASAALISWDGWLWPALALAALMAVLLRQTARCRKALTVGDGQAPRNNPT